MIKYISKRALHPEKALQVNSQKTGLKDFFLKSKINTARVKDFQRNHL